MRNDWFVGARLAGALLLAGALVAPATVHAQGVTVALTPVTQTVDPGAEFDLSITVTQEGSAFNGFDAVVGYDASALTLLPLSPTSLQEGELLTSACGETFHLFRTGADTDTITDVLLCNGVSVTGPGRIYRLRFRASTVPQITEVHFLPGLQFYEAGLYVNPVNSTDATIGIGTAVGVGPPATPRKLELTVAPNPARGGGTSFTIESDRAGLQRLRVFDLRGRLVRRFDDTRTAGGPRTVHWDGRDSLGHPLPAGIYLVTLELEGRSVTNRVSLLR